jgi:type IV pilus assembly protein PilQ
LNLKDTKIFKYRQRPLITTRFESAVNRILPIQTAEMANNAMVVVELREAVPYTVEQIDGEINIHFDASTVPPKQLAKADLPPWQKVMEESAEKGIAAGVTSEMAAPTPDVTEPEASEPQMPAEEVAEPVIEPEIQEEVDIDVSPEPESMDDSMVVVEEEEIYRPKKKYYTGEKIALDFYETDIKNVLRILRDVSGKNFAVDDDVTGKVTLTLVKPVPWDQVLDLILKMNNLGKTYEGDVVRIVTLATLQLEEEQRAEALKARQDRKKQEQALEPLITEYIPISYADATKDIKPRLDEIKTPERGTVGVDLRNNQIIMTDIESVIRQAKVIVKKIDKVTPQVIIEARIVEVNDDYSKELGTEWGMTGNRDTTTDPGVSATSGWSVAMNNPPSNEAGTIGYNFARISGSFALNAQLKAIETTDKGKIISSPKVVTLDNKEAIIKQGLEYPYLERDSAGLATVEFKDVDLELKVTPHVTPDNRISMKIDITKNDVESLIDGVPALSTNEAHTELLVNDGDTIVIGGIMKGNFRDEEQGFPWLAKVPLIGWAFKTKIIAEETHELLIFITPRIVELEKNL